MRARASIPTGKKQRSHAEAPSFRGLVPASQRTSTIARASSHKSGTECELLLRRALRDKRLRYRIRYQSLPGKPDLIFPKARVIVFCDGDFWHGRHLKKRLSSLRRGHNGHYWTDKISYNVAKDRKQDRAFKNAGWIVLRFWETDIYQAPQQIAGKVAAIVKRHLCNK
jgi:DNA mismatch endonuclease, patch repair protein